jgi:hypothetical protein
VRSPRPKRPLSPPVGTFRQWCRFAQRAASPRRAAVLAVGLDRGLDRWPARWLAPRAARLTVAVDLRPRSCCAPCVATLVAARATLDASATTATISRRCRPASQPAKQPHGQHSPPGRSGPLIEASPRTKRPYGRR